MISNYFKLALRVLGRKKFFTAITLFGISFTLAILMLILSIMETEVGETKPLSKKDSIVVVPSLKVTKMFYDTIYTVDTSIIDGIVALDSTYKVEDAGSNNSNNQFAWQYLDRYLSDVPSAVNYTFYNDGSVFNAYINNAKVEMKTCYTDHRYWEIFDFEFIEGFGFSEASVSQEEPVAVITSDLAEDYFGRGSGVIGEQVELDGLLFKVIGVIKPPGVSLATSNITVPHTLLKTVGRGEEVGFGGFMAVYLADGPGGVKRVKDDIGFINSSLEVHPSLQEYYNQVILTPWTYHEIYTEGLLGLSDEDDTGKSLSMMKKIMLGLLGLFILLPTINLINLNVGRMYERSAEIGVRKAFGASQSTILWQFIIENVIQTLLGGIIGMALAMIMIYLINDARLMGDIILKINYKFFLYSIIITLIFGVMSGLLPAYRMSKLHVVNALNNKI